MNNKTTLNQTAFALAVAAAVMLPTHAMAQDRQDQDHQIIDFGLKMEKSLNKTSSQLFGVESPLQASAPATEGAYRTEYQSAMDQVMLADGLKAHYLTRQAGHKTDMFAFWPNAESATHLVTCVEGSREVIGQQADGNDKYNPSIQRIELKTGAVETILRGMSRCDGIRNTGWGSILATEEASDGYAFELINPLTVTEQTVVDRGMPGFPADITDSNNIAKRFAMPTMAWEGLTVLPTGVVIGGDELRPGTAAADADGGALFKFVPAVPRMDGQMISSLDQSPLVNGNSYAMQVSCRDSKQQFGQGCEVGNGVWLAVDAANARTSANEADATGYYRPEDLHKDPVYNGEGVRFCWTNTGNKGAQNYGEVMCGIDSQPLVTDANQRTVVVNRFVEGDTDLNAPDNLAFQPITGNLYVIEDNQNGDIFGCLTDGADRDIKTDGCVKILSVKDSSAEPTGFMFSADGKTAYVSIQHSNDELMPEHDHYGTDDLLVITGFKVKH